MTTAEHVVKMKRDLVGDHTVSLGRGLRIRGVEERQCEKKWKPKHCLVPTARTLAGQVIPKSTPTQVIPPTWRTFC